MSAEQQWADLATHHIEGFTEAGHVLIPLITEITGELWVGGCVHDVRLPDEFRYVTSLYPWEQYQLPPGCERVEAPLLDGAEIPPADQLYQLAGHVNQCLRRGRTLVHCQAGLNRSNLISALALMTGPDPLSAEDAIALLREKRSPLVLCNPVFEAWLRAQPGTLPEAA